MRPVQALTGNIVHLSIETPTPPPTLGKYGALALE